MFISSPALVHGYFGNMWEFLSPFLTTWELETASENYHPGLSLPGHAVPLILLGYAHHLLSTASVDVRVSWVMISSQSLQSQLGKKHLALPSGAITHLPGQTFREERPARHVSLCFFCPTFFPPPSLGTIRDGLPTFSFPGPFSSSPGAVTIIAQPAESGAGVGVGDKGEGNLLFIY